MKIVTIKNKEIAERLGIHHQTITDIKSGKKKLNIKHYKKLKLFYKGKIRAIKKILNIIHEDEEKD